MAGGGGTDDGNGENGARGFAQAHIQFQQRCHADALQEPRMPGLGGGVADLAVVQGAFIQAYEDGRRGGAAIAVQQHRHP